MMDAAEVRPFPWAKVPGLSRREIYATQRLRAVAESFVVTRDLSGALGRLLGVSARAVLRSVRPAAPGDMPDNALGVLLAHDGDGPEASGVLVAAEPALAATLVGRAIGRPVPALLQPRALPSHELAGGLAAIVRAVVATSFAAASAPRIVTAGPADTIRPQALRASSAYVARFTVVIDEQAFTGLVVVDAESLPRPVIEAFDRRELASLGRLPLGLPVVAAWCGATYAEIATLAPGDVLLTGREARGARGRIGLEPWDFQGEVVLVPARAEVGMVAEARDSGAVVLSEHRASVPLVAPEARSLSRRGPPVNPNDTPIDALADVPLVVRVELGVAELSASAWAKTRPGDVLTLGRKVGDPVVLRVSGTEIAQGELVHVDGELAVRILSRSGDLAR